MFRRVDQCREKRRKRPGRAVFHIERSHERIEANGVCPLAIEQLTERNGDLFAQVFSEVLEASGLGLLRGALRTGKKIVNYLMDFFVARVA